jgi:flagellar hook-length control protein FliK
MQTPSIQNITNLTANQPATKTSDNAGAETNFGQLLDRQIAQREPTKAPEAPKPAAPTQAAKAPTQTPATAKSDAVQDQAANPSSPPVTTDTDIGKPAVAKLDIAVKKDDKLSVIDDGKNTPDTTNTTLAASAAILALVTNAGNAVTKSATTADPATPTTLQPAIDPNRLAGNAGGASGIDLAAKAGARQITETLPADVGTADGKAIADAFGAALQNAGKSLESDAPALKSAEQARTNSTDVSQLIPQFQTAALNIAPPSGMHPGDILAPRVGNDGWDQTLGQRMVWMVAGAEQSASLTLNPPDLGPMQVVLHVSNGQADASFFAAQPEVRQALEAAMPKLREMLSEAGVSLGQTSVSAGQPQQQQASDRRASSSRSASATSIDGIGATGTTGTISSGRIIGGTGMVDTFA